MKKLYYTLLLALIACSGQSFAQANLSVQGVIKNSDGSAVENGKYDLTFKLYNVETGGTALWEETQDQKTVTGGIYSILLGETNALNVPFNETYYLGVSVDGAAEMTPRARLTSSPYALSLLGESNLFSSSGNVGIGTTNPLEELHVKTDGATNATVFVDGQVGSAVFFRRGGTHDSSIGIYEGLGDHLLVHAANAIRLKSNNAYNIEFLKDNELVGYFHENGLNVQNTNGPGYFKVSGNDEARMDLIRNGVPQWAGMVYNSNGDQIIYNDGGDLGFWRQGTVHGYINANGWGFNSTIYAHGNTSTTNQIIYFNTNTAPDGPYGTRELDYLSSSTFSTSIKADFSIDASQFSVYSDARIKKDLRQSNGAADLHTLNQLEVTDYRHIDVAAKGNAYKKGFIAQQVKEVFPEAVTLAEDFIPNVYGKATTCQLSGDNLTIELPASPDLAIGDEVRLITEEDTKGYKVTAVEGQTFTVEGWTDAQPEKVFVYGKKVDDFHQVDYDRIHTLNVSATQELARMVADLQKENAGLKKENSTLRSDVNDLGSRMAKLESWMSSTAQK